MHTADIVRRDAVEQRIWFQSERAQNETDAIIVVYHEEQQNNTDLIYTIDLENDIVKTITFDVDGRACGSLIFSYLQDLQNTGNAFTPSTRPPGTQPPIQQSPGIRWLINLARGKLGK